MIDQPVIEQETDDFLKAIQRPTTQDANPPQSAAAPPPQAPPKPPTDDDDLGDLGDPELLADLAIEVADLLMMMVATGIAGEQRPEFEVSEYKRKKIKKPLAVLLARYGTKVDPWIVFAVAFVAVYGPVLYNAIQIKNAKKKKAAAIKAAEQKAKDLADPELNLTDDEIILRRSAKGGRPPGTTKEAMEQRRRQEQRNKKK